MASLFNVEKQLTFYGAYHSNKVNVAIHLFGVPLIMWSAQVLGAMAPVPDYFPVFNYKVNEYMLFQVNWASIQGAIYLLYYLALEPLAAILYVGQMAGSVLTATAFSQRPDAFSIALGIHVFAWIIQFIGHGVYEKRAPALLDNLLGAVVLAPFFVHLEMLFSVGYRPDFHKRLVNEIGKEITRVRKEEGEKKRTAEAKKSS